MVGAGPHHCDVLIAGAGPAGCATTLSLASFAPGLRVVLVDAEGPSTAAIGETAPPQIRPFLIHLGLWDAFAASGHQPSYRTLTAWGDALLRGNEFLLHTHQTGWRLDRAALDAMLREAASARVTGFIRAKVTGLALLEDGQCVRLSDGAEVEARFLIDATGPAGVLSRLLGLKPATLDSLVGSVMRVGSRTDGTEGLITESFAEGWWYTVAVPGSGRVVACMTDANLARRLGLSETSGFLALLSKTSHVRNVVDLDVPLGVPQMRPASTRSFAGADSAPLISVGDAAMSLDPLAGQGIVRALRCGVFAAYAAGDWLTRGDASGLSRYRLLMRREFAANRLTLTQYYAREQRWRERAFWRRRQSMSGAEAETSPSSQQTLSTRARDLRPGRL